VSKILINQRSISERCAAESLKCGGTHIPDQKPENLEKRSFPGISSRKLEEKSTAGRKTSGRRWKSYTKSFVKLTKMAKWSVVSSHWSVVRRQCRIQTLKTVRSVFNDYGLVTTDY